MCLRMRMWDPRPCRHPDLSGLRSHPPNSAQHSIRLEMKFTILNFAVQTLSLSRLSTKKAALRTLYLACIAAMMAWALAFPSWFGTIYLMWAAFSICLPARNMLLPSLPLLVAYGSLIIVLEYVAALPVLTIPDTVSGWLSWMIFFPVCGD